VSATEGTIREETSADHGAIAALLTDAFTGAAEARLVQRLRSEHAEVYGPALVAEVDGTVAGYAALTRVGFDDGRTMFALAPVAVLPVFQGMGVGSSLVERLVGLVDDPVVVVGEPSYYRRFGFEPALALGVRSAWDDAGDAWMIRLPSGAGRTGWAGTVRYPAPFAEV
jgi:putative acetyltransferase